MTVTWENLDEDLNEEFALFVDRADEIDDAFERWSCDRRQRLREKINLRLAAGCCALCDEKRAPDSSRCCAEHLRHYAAYHAQWRAEAVAAGRCVAGCGRAIRKTTNARPRPPIYCDECIAAQQRRHTDEIAAGRCRQFCGRPIREVKRWTRGKPPTTCEECAAAHRARVAATWAKKPKLLVQAAPVRAHLLELHALGIAWHAMAAVAGVSVWSMRRVARVTTLRVSARIAEPILELEAVLREEH